MVGTPNFRAEGFDLTGRHFVMKSFKEKPQVKRGWVNGGFFVANSKFLNSIGGDKEILEKKPLEKASKNKQLSAYRHYGFWKCMDTLRDKNVLDEIFRKK